MKDTQMESFCLFSTIFCPLARPTIGIPPSWEVLDSLEAELSRRDQVGLGVAWERQDDGSASGRRPAGALPCNSQDVGEAALAAGLITA